MRSNRYLRALISAATQKDPNEAIVEVVGRHRMRGDNLEHVAVRLGIADIVSVALSFDGGIFDIEGRLIIRLNSLASPDRQHFTLAHEIGHLILARYTKAQRKCSGNAALEKACDQIAGELLLPAEEVSKSARAFRRETPEALRSIAKQFDVSLQSTAIRLRDLKLWRRSVGLWQIADGRAVQIWFVGDKPWTGAQPTFEAFKQVTTPCSVVEKRELCWKGAMMSTVTMNVLNMGRDRLLATISAR